MSKVFCDDVRRGVKWVRDERGEWTQNIPHPLVVDGFKVIALGGSEELRVVDEMLR